MRLQGHSVSLYAGNVGPNEVEAEVFDDLNGNRIDSLSRTVSPIKDFKAVFELRKTLKSVNADVINTHTFKAGLIGRLANMGLPTKVVHTYHGHLLYGYLSPMKSKIYIILERILGSLTDVFIAVGRNVQSELLNQGIGSTKKFRVIYPAIRELIFTNGATLRKMYGFAEEDFVIGWLGRFTSIKQPSLFLELAVMNPGLKFLIGGDGELKNDLLVNLPVNVSYVGWVKPEDFWPACNVGVLTSANEGLPTSVIEAQQAAIPSVAFNVGSVSEVIISDFTGYLVKDLNEFCEKIISLKENSELADRLGLQAKEYSRTHFNKDIFIDKHLELYANL